MPFWDNVGALVRPNQTPTTNQIKPNNTLGIVGGLASVVGSFLTGVASPQTTVDTDTKDDKQDEKPIFDLAAAFGLNNIHVTHDIDVGKTSKSVNPLIWVGAGLLAIFLFMSRGKRRQKTTY